MTDIRNNLNLPISDQVVDILSFAHARLKHPTAWRKFRAAEDVNGMWTSATSRDAACFCASGAIANAAHEFAYTDYAVLRTEHLFREANNILTSIERWNDRKIRTHGDVLRAFRVAIQAAKGVTR